MMMSDIQIASLIIEADRAPDTSFVRGNLYIQPQPSATFVPGMSMYVYFEIYNLKRDEFGQTRYTISYEVQKRQETGFALVSLLAKLGKKNTEAVGLSFDQVGTNPTKTPISKCPSPTSHLDATPSNSQSQTKTPARPQKKMLSFLCQAPGNFHPVLITKVSATRS